MRVSRPFFVISISCVSFMIAGGCGNKKDPNPSPGGNAQAVATQAERIDAFEDLQTHWDLVSHAHLADVDDQGLFIDFGTAADHKYTAGGWKTGWGDAGTEGQVTFKNVGTTGRVYFLAARPEPITLRFRMKPVGTPNMLLFLNSKPLPSVRFEAGSPFREYDVAVPADAVKTGENHLLLRFDGSVPVGGHAVAAAIDSIRVLRGAAPAPAAGAAPYQLPALSASVAVDGETRNSLVTRPGMTLSYYVDVPANAKLALGVGTDTANPQGLSAKVSIQPEGAAATEVFSRSVDDEWHDEVISLDNYAGQVVRIDLRTDGNSGRVAWGVASLMLPKPDDVEAVEPARNVVVLLIDTMRADKLRAFNPRTRVRSPAIDQIASQSAVFLNAQAPENWTKPSCASVLTSTFPTTHGAKQDASRLPDQAVMLSETFKAAGFGTATFLANGYVSDRFGFDQGWDHYTNFIRENKPTSAVNLFREAGDWIERNKDKRFFVYIQTIDPHVPYDPPAEFLNMYDSGEYTGVVSPRLTADQLEKAKRRPPAVTFTERDRQRLEALYDGEVSYHDRELGKFVERMKQLNLWDNTVFVIISDHGEEFYEHQSFGHGHSLFQELLHVPFLVRAPGTLNAPRRIEQTVSTVDVGPTIVELTGLGAVPTHEGHSLVQTIQGQRRAGPSVAFSDFLEDRRTIRAGRYKLILRGINAEFFDLQRDPTEQNVLDMTRQPIAARYLRVMIGQFLGATNKAEWTEATQSAPANRFGAETTVVDPETRAGIRALGYAN